MFRFQQLSFDIGGIRSDGKSHASSCVDTAIMRQTSMFRSSPSGNAALRTD
jgi:hypothetical protein